MVLVPRSLLAVSLLLLAGCTQQSSNEQSDDRPAPSAAAADKPTSQLPSVDPPLTRRDVLLAVANEASAYASGMNPAQLPTLDGRPFSFRMRLCENAGSNYSLSFDAERRVRKISARPDLTLDLPQVRTLIDPAKFDGAEGFRVARPWLLDAACPIRRPASSVAPPTQAEATAAPAQLGQPAGAMSGAGTSVPVPPAVTGPFVGLAEYYPVGGARSARRKDRAYELTRKLGADEQPGPIDLILQGRLRRLDRGRVINCTGDADREPPTCIVSIQLDTVRMEDSKGSLLGEWIAE